MAQVTNCIAASDITGGQIEKAMEWAAPPLAELFKSPMKLKPHDLVTMKLSELGHMLAWYAELQRPRVVEAPRLAEDVEPSYHSYLLASGAIDDDKSPAAASQKASQAEEENVTFQAAKLLRIHRYLSRQFAPTTETELRSNADALNILFRLANELLAER